MAAVRPKHVATNF